MNEQQGLAIKQVKEEVFSKRPVYRVFASDSTEVGVIFWQQSKYIFSSNGWPLFGIVQLKAIIEFIENLTPKTSVIKPCEHEYSDGTGVGFFVCRKCGDMV